MSPVVPIARLNLVRSSARGVLKRLWDQREQIWDRPPPSFHHLFPLDVRQVAVRLYELIYEEPEEIPNDSSRTETMGVLDRAGNRIIVAQKYRREWRRYTGAHELAHFLLHPEEIHHRDRPLTGAEHGDPRRPPLEVEADAFAAELLMPGRLVSAYFTQRFGEARDPAQITDDQLFMLSMSSRRITSLDFKRNGQSFRALTFANATGGGAFTSLADRFGVSQTAMAIQLEKLGLVR